jgi:3-methyladenine DNA glycosylase Tag
MCSFDIIFNEALFRQGGLEALTARLPVPRTPEEIRKRSSEYYFSMMSRRIFRAGLKHSMVDRKWPAFEKVFYNFNIEQVRMMSDETLESLLNDRSIIRHWGKIKAIRENAEALHELESDGKTVGSYIADWPVTRIIELWEDLSSRFSHLGGNSGPYLLRMAGKDTFLLTEYVVRALIKWNAVEKRPTGKKSLSQVQEIMNHWSGQNQRPLCQISMILAMSVD